MRIMCILLIITYTLSAQNYHYAVDQKEIKNASPDELSFRLKAEATTSAGVYKGETLLRTLWSNERKEKGTHAITWDGLDDEGLKVTPGKYEIKVLANNVEYEWEGAKIGNTSKDLTGSNRYHGLTGFFKFIVVDADVFWSNGYNEQRTAAYRSSLSEPQVTTPVLDKGAIVKYICSDDSFVYWSAHDVYAHTSFVFVTNRSDNQEYVYSKAQPLKATHARTYRSALNVLEGEDSYITGLARSGTYLFVARQLNNTIDVLDLDEGGSLVQTITSVDAPRELVADNNGALWIINGDNNVSKYSVNSDNGSLSNTGLSLGELEEPLTLGLSPDGRELAVCDGGGRQQIRFFNPDNGTEGLPFGQLGGYKNGPTVLDDKFYFTDSKTKKFDADIYTPQYNHAAITFENDGSFWVLDTGNNRMMHYDANRIFIEKIQYTPDWLMMSIDKNNPSRLFVDFLEYQIDHSKEDVGNSWELKYNWGYSISDAYNNPFGKIKEPITLDNGRTYFLLRNDRTFEIAELTENGIRITESILDQLDWAWSVSGDLIYISGAGIGAEAKWEIYDLIGFDVRGDPQFSEGRYLAKRTRESADEPLYRGTGWMTFGLIDNHKLVSFDGLCEANGYGKGYHLGLIDTDTNEWIFKTSRATGSDYKGDYPLDGRFDTGNGVLNAGSKAMVFGDHIIWGYYGEFWKGGYQTNQYAHYWKNGLLINVFGTNWTKNPNGLRVDENGGPVFTPFEGMSGNALSPAVVQHPTDSDMAYLYHPDESWQGGVHRWKISNLKSILEYSMSIVVD